ncbi:MAG: cellulase family glycosylhydrolase, partial [Solimonas sp.]
GGTDRPSDFSDHATVSFVGRPFPLADADEHLGRLRGWGFNALRMVVTWEAVEHAGPGQYDSEFIESIGRICERAADHGFFIFIDFHQDVWSRMSGGSGAPCWIFDKLGLDYRTFGVADAAHVMQYKYDYGNPERRQEDRYPAMGWTINYKMPVNGILWTAFFAGRSFTPDWTVDGLNVQDYLQQRYFGAVRALAQRVRDLPNVIGFDSFNEPGLGWIGQRMSEVRTGPTPDDRLPVLSGPAWTPITGLTVARGLSVTLPVMRPTAQPGFVEHSHETQVNRRGVSIWKAGVTDPFEQAGAWKLDDGRAVVPDEDFFRLRKGQRVDAERDFLAPFFAQMAATIREVRADWLLFAEINPHVVIAGRTFPAQMPERSVNACHWYDVMLLWSKRYVEAPDDAAREQIKKRYGLELAYMKSLGDRLRMPTLIGEFGIPYDLNDGDAYARWAQGERSSDVWRAHAAALELMYETLDLLQLSSTQWNYCASNRNDLRIGDGWNQEDLSIFSRDQQGDGATDDGGRAVDGFRRPYVQRAQGIIKEVRWSRRDGLFVARIAADPKIEAPSELYLPPVCADYTLELSGAAADAELDGNTLRVRAREAGELRIELKEPQD